MLRSWLIGLCSVLFLPTLASCADEPNGLRVRLLTSIVPVAEFRRIEVEVLRGTNDRATVLATSVAVPLRTTAFDTSRSVAYFGDLSAGDYIVRLRLRDAADRTVAERSRFVHLEGPTETTIRIARACLNIACPRDAASGEPLECEEGVCVDPHCTADSRETCPAALFCDDGATCAPASSCSSVACVEGSCVYSPLDDTNACDSTQWCAPEEGGGCIAFPSNVPPDATVECGTICRETVTQCSFGYWDCTEDLPFCRPLFAEIAGNVCGEGAVCDGEGHCNACASGSACLVGCALGTVSCEDGEATCVLSGTPDVLGAGEACPIDRTCIDASSCMTDGICSDAGVCDAPMSIPVSFDVLPDVLDVGEDGSMSGFDIVLSERPERDVVFTVTLSDEGRDLVSLSGDSAAIRPDFADPVIYVTATGLDDGVFRSHDTSFTIAVAVDPTRSDPRFAALGAKLVTVRHHARCTEGAACHVGCDTGLTHCVDGAPTCTTGAGMLATNDPCPIGEACFEGETCLNDGVCDAGGDCIVPPLCTTDNGGCDPLRACLSTMGSEVSCGPCPSGYAEDGPANCADIDECAAHSDTCGFSQACTNTTGSFTCSGIPPYPTFSAMGYSSCLLAPDQNLKCWGRSNLGQLGHGNATAHGNTVASMGTGLPITNLGLPVREISAGREHMCVIVEDGRVKCWGSNGRGELGLGDTAHRGDTPDETPDLLPFVDLGTGRTAQHICGGGQHTCALLDDDTVRCWGRGDLGQLGAGNTISRGDAAGEMGDSLVPVNFGTGRHAVSLACGEWTSCALLDDATVKCWGAGGTGVLGEGVAATARGDTPSDVGDAWPVLNLGAGRTVKFLTVGLWHACAILDNDELKCWGQNGAGQLGLGDTLARGESAGEMGDALPAVALPAGRHAVYVATNWASTFAILDDGSLVSWGSNFYGELGHGDMLYWGDGPGEMGDALVPVSLPTGRHAVAVDGGNYWVCAVFDDARTGCWGNSTVGELGVGYNGRIGDTPTEMGDHLAFTNLGPRL